MEFSPANKIVQLCILGMEKETLGETEAAAQIFLQAWDEATNDFEKFLAAHYVARQQKNLSVRLHWFQLALQQALTVNNIATTSALPSLYINIAQCHAQLNDPDHEKKYLELANAARYQVADKGPFYHGTKADLQTGDLLTPGFNSNYHAELTMNHIYFTALVNGAGLAAALAQGNERERVYIIEPIGNFESDPNVTDKKFPGNPTRSYRTPSPLKIVGEITEWTRPSAEEIQKWREKLARFNKGDIIN